MVAICVSNLNQFVYIFFLVYIDMVLRPEFLEMCVNVKANIDMSL